MKKILIILGILLLVGTIIAIGELTRSDSAVSIGQDKIDLIKSTGIENINIKANPIQCDDKECWTWIYQDNLINAEFRIAKTPKIECIETEKALNEETGEIQDTGNCLVWKDYTAEELIQLRDAFIKERLESYANAIKMNSEKSTITVTDEGIVTAS